MGVCCRLVNQMVYSGLSLNSKSLSGDPYVNFLLCGLAEVPGILLALALVDKVGRKACICCGLLVAAVCCCVAGFVHLGKWFTVSVAGLARHGAGCSKIS